MKIPAENRINGKQTVDTKGYTIAVAGKISTCMRAYCQDKTHKTNTLRQKKEQGNNPCQFDHIVRQFPPFFNSMIFVTLTVKSLQPEYRPYRLPEHRQLFLLVRELFHF